MSEPMEVECGGDWYPCLYVSPADAAGDIAIVYEEEGEYMTCHVFSDEKNRLRPATKPEVKVDADGWCVKYYEDGFYSVRRFRNRRCVDALSPHGTIIAVDEWIKGSNEDTLFRSEAVARSALATWREKNKPFVPTPHEPVEGVTLWDSEESADDDRGGIVDVFVDGIFAGSADEIDGTTFDESEVCRSDHYQSPVRSKRFFPMIPALAAFRDRIRSERAAKSKPSPLTPEQEAAVREIVKDVMNAPTFEARSV